MTFPVIKIHCSDLFPSSVCLSDSQQSERSLEASEPWLRTGSIIWDALHDAQIKEPLLKEPRTRHSGCCTRSSVWRPFKPVQLTGATLHEASPASAAWQGPFSHLPEHRFLLFIRIYFLGKKNHGFAVSFIHKYNPLFFRPLLLPPAGHLSIPSLPFSMLSAYMRDSNMCLVESENRALKKYCLCARTLYKELSRIAFQTGGVFINGQ